MLNDHSELGIDLRALADFSMALAQPFTVLKDVCANMPLVSVLLLAHSLFFLSLLYVWSREGTSSMNSFLSLAILLCPTKSLCPVATKQGKFYVC